MEKILVERVRADEQTEDRTIVRPFRDGHPNAQAGQHREQEATEPGSLVDSGLERREREESRGQRERARGQPPTGIGKEVHVPCCREATEHTDHIVELEFAEKITRAHPEDELRERDIKLVERYRFQ